MFTFNITIQLLYYYDIDNHFGLVVGTQVVVIQEKLEGLIYFYNFQIKRNKSFIPKEKCCIKKEMEYKVSSQTDLICNSYTRQRRRFQYNKVIIINLN